MYAVGHRQESCAFDGSGTAVLHLSVAQASNVKCMAEQLHRDITVRVSTEQPTPYSAIHSKISDAHLRCSGQWSEGFRETNKHLLNMNHPGTKPLSRATY